MRCISRWMTIAHENAATLVCRRRAVYRSGSRGRGATAETAGRVDLDQRAAGAGPVARRATAHQRVCVRAGGSVFLCLLGGAPADEGAAGDQPARLHDQAGPQGLMPTAAHFLYIPGVLLVGIVIGWILGSRAAADAYAAQLRRQQKPKP